MFVIPNQVGLFRRVDVGRSLTCLSDQMVRVQSSLPLAWKSFTPAGRLLPSSNRDRLVDVCEELVKLTLLLRPQESLLEDRYSERLERRSQGRLLTQAEKEAGNVSQNA
jgi:hypothetical protein